MVTGNSMNISYLSANKFQSDLKIRRLEVENALSLGANPMYILDNLQIIPDALKSSITPANNTLRTLGLVTIPGLMTGLLIGGVHPIAAALLQVMIFFLILAGGLSTGIIVIRLLIKEMFEKNDQRMLI